MSVILSPTLPFLPPVSCVVCTCIYCSPSVFTGVIKLVGWMSVVGGTQLNHNNNYKYNEWGQDNLLLHLKWAGPDPGLGVRL